MGVKTTNISALAPSGGTNITPQILPLGLVFTRLTTSTWPTELPSGALFVTNRPTIWVTLGGHY